MRRRLIVIRFVASTVAVTVAVAIVNGIAVLGEFDLPAGVRSSVVRVRGYHEYDEDGRRFLQNFGSGVIVDVRRDTTGSGGWVCVLTADHVAGWHNADGPANQNWGGRKWAFSNMNGNRQGPWIETTSRASVIRGPDNGRTRVDLTVIGFRLADVTGFHAVAPVEPMRGANIGLAGYGDTGTARQPDDPLPRRYDIDIGYGTYRDGPNTIDRLGMSDVAPGDAGNQYQFQAIFSDLDFTVDEGRITAGEGYFLNHDSGGPTFQYDAATETWGLVGIHQNSLTQGTRRQSYQWAFEGNVQDDVNVWEYRRWLANSCAQAVPEPASLIALGIGIGVISLARRRRS